MEIKKCAFSGHRPKSFPWGYNEDNDHCRWLKRQIEIQIDNALNAGFNYFITGGAMGVDMWCAECVLLKKKQYIHGKIQLEVAVPFLGYDKWFERKLKLRQEKIIKSADKLTVTSPQNNNIYQLYHIRNKYLVNNSQRIIIVYDEQSNITGGTYQTYLYAKKTEKEIIMINWLSEYNQRYL